MRTEASLSLTYSHTKQPLVSLLAVTLTFELTLKANPGGRALPISKLIGWRNGILCARNHTNENLHFFII